MSNDRVDITTDGVTTEGCDSRMLLPDGQWADFRNPSVLRARDRKDLYAKIDEDKTVGRVSIEMLDGVMGLLVLGWSYPVAPPCKDLSVLGDLTIEVEDALQSHPYVTEATTMLVKGRETTKVSADPESPTQPSGA